MHRASAASWYGIPCPEADRQCEAWYFRKDIVEKYNMDFVAENGVDTNENLVSLQDLEKYLAIIKENEPDMVPYYVSAGTGVHMEWITDVIRDDPYRYEELQRRHEPAGRGPGDGYRA